MKVVIPTNEELRGMTPMMQQYYSLKKERPDAIMFFRMGDFYEIFGSDAEVAAPFLELVLTSRERGDKNKIKFCGVPHHSANSYILKLIKAGYKVAIADQLEDPSASKGIVKRGIVKIITPGCTYESDSLSSEDANYLLAVYEDPAEKTWALSLADVSTGEIRLGSLESLEEVQEFIKARKPREILARRFMKDFFESFLNGLSLPDKINLEELPESPLQNEIEQDQYLIKCFGSADFTLQPSGRIDGGVPVVSSLLAYVASLKMETSQFNRLLPLEEPDTTPLSETVIRDLEVFETTRHRKARGSLFYEVNKTLTPMGARYLKWSLSRLMQRKEAIQCRHDSVDILCKLGEEKLNGLRGVLKNCGDVTRIATRVVAMSAKPIELAKLRETLRSIEELKKFIDAEVKDRRKNGLNIFKAQFAKGFEILTLLEEALADSPEALGKGNLIFKMGFDHRLDDLNLLANEGQTRVSAYEAKLREETGITSLKVKPHKTFGLLLEVTKTNLSKVPDSFIRRQTMVNCERFTTLDLKELDETLAAASEKAVLLEHELYGELLRRLSGFNKTLQDISLAIAHFDLLQGFAWLATKENYSKPQLDNANITLVESRHPVVESFVGKYQFISNNVDLSHDFKHMLITGPNMAGKSTVMRQTAVSAILNQAGSFVPATTAHLPIFDQVFTRVGASDDLSTGQSTFMVEMSEAATILRQATGRSLVILDEVGRGTSTEDGLAIASAILNHLVEKVSCWSLFATHYHELVDLAEKLKTVSLMQTEVIQDSEGITFTHRLKPGFCGSSFGVEVAKLAGVPARVINLANEYLEKHEQILAGSAPAPLEVLIAQKDEKERKLSPVVGEIIERLERININKTTPLKALNLLEELQGVLTNKAVQGEFNLGIEGPLN